MTFSKVGLLTQEAIRTYFEPLRVGFSILRGVIRGHFKHTLSKRVVYSQLTRRRHAYERRRGEHWPELDALVSRLLDEQEAGTAIKGVTINWCVFGDDRNLQQAFRRVIKKHPPIQAVSRFHTLSQSDSSRILQVISANSKGLNYYILWLCAPLTDDIQRVVAWAAEGARSGSVFPIAGSTACLKSIRAEQCTEYFDAVSIEGKATWEILDRVIELKLSEFLAAVPTLFPSPLSLSQVELSENTAVDDACPPLHIPRYRAQGFAKLVLTTREYERCIQPMVLDFQHDYLSAIRRCDERSAIWIWLRGNAEILLATLIRALTSAALRRTTK
jgi:hypothetical protein